MAVKPVGDRLNAPGSAHPQGLRPFGSGAVQFSTGVTPGGKSGPQPRWPRRVGHEVEVSARWMSGGT